MLRLIVSGGEGEPTPDLFTCQVATVFITARSYALPPSQVYEEGFKAIVSSLRQNSSSWISGMKSPNYLPNLLARREAKVVGADEAILLNEQGFLAEGSTCNIFLVAQEQLLSLGKDSGILPGITCG